MTKNKTLLHSMIKMYRYIVKTQFIELNMLFMLFWWRIDIVRDEENWLTVYNIKEISLYIHLIHLTPLRLCHVGSDEKKEIRQSNHFVVCFCVFAWHSAQRQSSHIDVFSCFRLISREAKVVQCSSTYLYQFSFN
jgi:hypothetical protein